MSIRHLTSCDSSEYSKSETLVNPKRVQQRHREMTSVYSYKPQFLKKRDDKTYKYYNPNPEKNHVGDCVVRALTIALDDTWDNAFIRLMAQAYEQKDMSSSNSVWGSLLTDNGFKAYKEKKYG